MLPDYIPKNAKLIPLKNVEVFAVGRWNNLDFVADDLACMVGAFGPSQREIHPVVITNHGEDTDGGENRGFVTALRLNSAPGVDYLGKPYGVSERVEADLLIDPELHEAISQGKYIRPSIELWPDYESRFDGTRFPWVITAISYQGGKHIEAVRTLRPAALQMSERPAHFSHNGRAKLFSQTFFKDVKTMEQPVNGQAMADPMQAMMGQMLELQKNLAASLSGLGGKLEALLLKKEEDSAKEDGKEDAQEKLEQPAPESGEPLPAEGKPEEEMMDKEKKVTMSDLQRRVTETERMLFAERKARKDEAELVAAREFVMARSNESCLKIPVKFRESVSKLIATAPSAEYREALKQAFDAAADKSVMFRDKTRLFHEETITLSEQSGPVAAVEAKALRFVQDGKAKHKGDAYKLVFAENPTLYLDYQAALNKARA